MRETSATSREDWVEREFVFTSQTGEEISGLGLFPHEKAAPSPALLYCHAHGYKYELGCGEIRTGTPSLVAPIWRDIADFCRDKAGFCPAILSIDMAAFGSRQQPNEDARAKAHAWRGTTLFGEMLSDLIAAVTFLAERPDIDADRMGAFGFSMGSAHAFWLAALDERIKAAAALCSFADLDTLIQTNAHDGHGHYMTVPGLTPEFTTGEVAGLAAPRALFIGAGMQDWSTPKAAFDKARNDLEAAYVDCPDQLTFHVEPDTGHEETPAMRQAALQFLEQNL
ncbi:MAG: dienelactone hydrolase family protein [Pseudomonadota bacterium]